MHSLTSRGEVRAGEPLDRAAGRLFFLDDLRTALTVLVVLHHVAMAYGAGGLGFYYVDLPPTGFSKTLLLFVLANQAWFMGAFFGVAGYFTPGSFERKGRREFLRSRSLRLGVPLVMYALVLNPLAATGWFHMPEEFEPLTWGEFDYLEHVRMGPTWFLALLLVFSVAYTTWRRFDFRTRARNLLISIPMYAVWATVLVVLVGGGYLIRMHVSVGESFLGFPSLAYLPQYLVMFAVGAVASRRGWLARTTVSGGLFAAASAAAATVVLFPLAFSGDWFSLELSAETAKAFGEGHWQSFVYVAWDSLLVLGLTVVLIVAFRAVRRDQGVVARFGSRHSYAVYLLHIPVVVYTAVAVSSLGLSHGWRLVTTAAIAVPASFGLAALVRRNLTLSRFL